MVACPNNPCIIGYGCVDSIYRRLGNFSFYLYNVLRIPYMDEPKVHNTISVLVLALLVGFLFTNISIALWIAVILLVNNIWFMPLNKYVVECWLRFAHGLERINSTILLSLTFFVALTPIACLYRICNKKRVENFKKNKRTSYFDTVGHTYGKEDFSKQW